MVGYLLILYSVKMHPKYLASEQCVLSERLPIPPTTNARLQKQNQRAVPGWHAKRGERKEVIVSSGRLPKGRRVVR